MSSARVPKRQKNCRLLHHALPAGAPVWALNSGTWTQKTRTTVYRAEVRKAARGEGLLPAPLWTNSTLWVYFPARTWIWKIRHFVHSKKLRPKANSQGLLPPPLQTNLHSRPPDAGARTNLNGLSWRGHWLTRAVPLLYFTLNISPCPGIIQSAFFSNNLRLATSWVLFFTNGSGLFTKLL